MEFIAISSIGFFLQKSIKSFRQNQLNKNIKNEFIKGRKKYILSGLVNKRASEYIILYKNIYNTTKFKAKVKSLNFECINSNDIITPYKFTEHEHSIYDTYQFSNFYAYGYYDGKNFYVEKLSDDKDLLIKNINNDNYIYFLFIGLGLMGVYVVIKNYYEYKEYIDNLD